MIVHICDRCFSNITGNQGMALEVTDTIRGVAGVKELCADCAGDYAMWWEKGAAKHPIQPVVPNEAG